VKKVILLRYGEIHLKGRNRGYFENLLLNNIKSKLKNIKCNILRIAGRYLITDFEDCDLIIKKLQSIFGLVSLSIAYEIETNEDLINKTVLSIFQDLEEKINLEQKTFKINVTRADKTFPFHSDTFSASVGAIVLNAFPQLKVKLKNPDIDLLIEIRENKKTYIYFDKVNCCGGMPVGCSGEGLLLLSGGIDSPVAGFMMAKRGLKINAIHFHSFPYTSLQAKEKVLTLASKLSNFNGKMKVFMVPFTKIQESIHANCDDSFMITIMRRIMLRIAEKICNTNNYKAIVTGESLGQVASQTIESITVTNNVLKVVPLLRPLIGMDKSEITKIAKNIDTFETSILPYEDCCTVFLPKNPVIKPTIEKCLKEESYLNIDELVDQAMQTEEIVVLKRD